MRRIALTATMLAFGALQIVGGGVSLVPTALLPFDQLLGSQASPAAMALGVGICAAAIRPQANLAWVRIALLYSLLVIGYQVSAHVAFGLPFGWFPLGTALAGSALLVAFLPDPGSLLPRLTSTSGATPAPEYHP